VADAITVTFACGHRQEVAATADAAPICLTCGDHRVTRTKARAPRFVGACQGPYCETKVFEPAIVNVAPAGPLKLKEQEHG
jgi:hypothetical protein